MKTNEFSEIIGTLRERPFNYQLTYVRPTFSKPRLGLLSSGLCHLNKIAGLS